MVQLFMKVNATAKKTLKPETDSFQFHQTQENSNLEKHTGRNVVAW